MYYLNPQMIFDTVFQVIKKHMQTCVENVELIRQLNQKAKRDEMYKLYSADVSRLQVEIKKIAAKKADLYEDYANRLISDTEYENYRNRYEEQAGNLEVRLNDALQYQQRYSKNFKIDADWEEVIHTYLHKKKLTQEMVDAFVERVELYGDNKVLVRLIYDDFLKELVQLTEERSI